MSSPTTTTTTTSPEPFHFQIDIYTDTVCPFSHLGHLSLTRAISSFSSSTSATFSLTYHPYILYPTARPSSRPLGEALKHIYSSHSSPSHQTQTQTQTSSSILTHLDNLASVYNTKFNWDGLTGNSRDSHRLVLLAQERFQHHPHPQSHPHPHPQPPTTHPHPPTLHHFLTHLHHSTFHLGHDISNRHTLASIGLSFHLFPTLQEGLAWFESGQLGAEVDEECERAKKKVGVRAVPSYVVNGRWVVGGMQEGGWWEGLFGRVIAQHRQEGIVGDEEGEGEEGEEREEQDGVEGEQQHGRNCRVVVGGGVVADDDGRERGRT
ncbi:thioredoxin-like protein [Cercophora samala]|uniref:Thioredoxin-like protein n=1 Tax=Cercophora samala TaxID=330535 RepID=A0AA40DGR7_9PEZI|nr:thioredoxin-like protein [Cercophora samala]